MVWFAETLWCDGCGVEIRWAPVESGEQAFCCSKCLKGERCQCADLSEEYPPSSSKQGQDFTLIGH